MLIDENVIEFRKKWNDLMVKFVSDEVLTSASPESADLERKQLVTNLVGFALVAARDEGITWDQIFDMKKDVEFIVDQKNLQKAFEPKPLATPEPSAPVAKKVEASTANGTSTSPEAKAEASAAATSAKHKKKHSWVDKGPAKGEKGAKK